MTTVPTITKHVRYMALTSLPVDDPSQAKEEKDDLDDLDYQLLPVVDDPSKPDEF